MDTIRIIKCKYCKQNVKTGSIHDCSNGRREASNYDAYYDGSCHLGNLFGEALVLAKNDLSKVDK